MAENSCAHDLVSTLVREHREDFAVCDVCKLLRPWVFWSQNDGQKQLCACLGGWHVLASTLWGACEVSSAKILPGARVSERDMHGPCRSA